jgi:hypothetical protein
MSLREKQVSKTTRNEQNPVWLTARVRDRFLIKFVVVVTNMHPSTVAEKAGLVKSTVTRVLNNPVVHYNWRYRTREKIVKATNPIVLQKITDERDLADYMTAVNKLVEFDPKKNASPVMALYDLMASFQGNRWGPFFRLIMEEITQETRMHFPPKEGDPRPFR